MDLRQQKLTSEEWDALERPVSKEEQRILQMINQGYNNVDILSSAIKILYTIKATVHSWFYSKGLDQKQLSFEDPFDKNYCRSF